MAGPRYVTREKYDKIRAYLEDKYHYDTLPDERKALFDAAFNRTITVQEPSSGTLG